MEAAIISEAITGEEDLGNLQQPEQALAQFYRALNRRNIDLMAQNWDNSTEIVMDNPLGGIKRGWSEIRPIYERVFSGAVTILSSTITPCMSGLMFFMQWDGSAATTKEREHGWTFISAQREYFGASAIAGDRFTTTDRSTIRSS
jgi:hypothetical protein